MAGDGECYCSLEELLRKAEHQVKEKKPGDLGREGKIDQAKKVAAAQAQRAKYDARRLETEDLTDKDFDELFQGGGALPVGGAGGQPPPGGGKHWIPPHNMEHVITSVEDVKIKGVFARYVAPMREIFGRSIQRTLETAHQQQQVTLAKLRASVMQTLMKNDIVPGRWYKKARPHIAGASEDSLEQILRAALSTEHPRSKFAADDYALLDPLDLAPTRDLRPNEQQAAREIREFISDIGRQSNGGLQRFLKAYRDKNRPMNVIAFTSSLSRKATLDKIMRPAIASVEGFVDPRMKPLFNEWTGMLQGRPTNAERSLTLTLTRFSQFMAQVPVIGPSFRGPVNPRIGLAFSEMVTNWFYMGGLGGRVASALRNFLDLNQTAAEIGPWGIAKGFAEMGRLMSTKGKRAFDELAEKGILGAPAEALDYEIRQLNGGNLMSDATHFMMSMFRGVDVINRGATFYGARAKFLKFARAGDADKIIMGKGLTTGARKDIRRTLKMMVADGKIDEAAEYYARDVTMNTQYVYGRANTPIALQGPIGRMFGMFSQWPINYAQFYKSLAEDGRRSAFLAHTMSTFALIYGAGEFLDVNLNEWMGAGSMPAELGVSGPLPRAALFGINAALSASKIAQAEILGDKWAQAKTLEFEKRNMAENYRQLRNTAAGVGFPGSSAFKDVRKFAAAPEGKGLRELILPGTSFKRKPSPDPVLPGAASLGGGIPSFAKKDSGGGKIFFNKGFREFMNE